MAKPMHKWGGRDIWPGQVSVLRIRISVSARVGLLGAGAAMTMNSTCGNGGNWAAPAGAAKPAVDRCEGCTVMPSQARAAAWQPA